MCLIRHLRKKKTIAISDAAGSSRDWTLEGRIRKR
jgi:hypothetical protein